MGLYDNIRSKTEDTRTSGPRARERADLVPQTEMLGGPAADYPAVPFREETAIKNENPRTLPSIPEEVLRAIEAEHEEDLPAHGPARGAAILRRAALKMLKEQSLD